jgi:malate dehydrogenase (oxaloacetate-decarboxylating)(NADP+)
MGEALISFRVLCNPFLSQVQGTGAVVLSGFLNAAHLASQASGRPLSEHRILFFGAGSAGIGVAKQLLSFFRFQGLSEADATKQIWVRIRCFALSMDIFFMKSIDR